MELNRSCYGFEIKKDFYKLAQEQMLNIDYKENKQIEEDENQIMIFDKLEG